MPLSSPYCYGSQTWTLLKADERRLEAFHCQRRIGIRWFHFVTNASVTSQTGEFVGGDSPFLVTCGDYRKRHQPTTHYAWLWTLVQAVNRTSGRSGSASVTERGSSRSRTTLGSTPTTPGGSHITASPQVLEGATTRGRSSVPPTD